MNYSDYKSNSSVSTRRGRNDFSSWDLPRLRDYIKKLEQETKKFESENQFDYANEILSQINDLKRIEVNKMHLDIKQRQIKERNEIDKAQKVEIIKFNQEMDKKYIEVERKWADMKEKVLSDHKKEMEDKIYWFNNNFPHNPKPSSEILNYQRILKGIIKQKNYEKANELNNLLKNIIHSEKLKWDVLRDKKLKHELDTLKIKHENELINFDVKMKKNMSDFKKNRTTEFDKIIQKYKNKLKELEQNHKIELSEFKNINIYNMKILSGEISSIPFLILEEVSKNKVFSSTERQTYKV